MQLYSYTGNRNVNFQALPGGKIKAMLINNPEKLQAITEHLAPLGDKNTVVDIFTATTQFPRKTIYSLRLYNKVFGSSHHVPFDKKNVEYLSSKLIPKVEQLNEKDIYWGENALFCAIKKFYAGGNLRYTEFFSNILKQNKEKGLELGAEAKKRFDKIWRD